MSPTKAEEGEAGDHLIYASPAHPGATLTYTGAPFPGGAVLAGPVSATIYAKPSSPNVIIIADLFDVAPDGKAQQLSTGGLVGSLRALDEAKSWRDKDGQLIRPYHTFTHDEPVKPGEVIRLDIQMQPRQAALAPGHNLRLVLKTQSDPKPCGTLFPGGSSFWCFNPTVTQRQALEGSSYEVEHNRQWPSLINVPVQSHKTGK
jgi:predicted acyl esterase